MASASMRENACDRKDRIDSHARARSLGFCLANGAPPKGTVLFCASFRTACDVRCLPPDGLNARNGPGGVIAKDARDCALPVALGDPPNQMVSFRMQPESESGDGLDIGGVCVVCGCLFENDSL